MAVLRVRNANGTWSEIPAIVGTPGAPGYTPQKGVDYDDGLPGVGVASVEQTAKSADDDGVNIIAVTLDDGRTSYFEVRNGSKGNTGEVDYSRLKDYAQKTEVTAAVSEHNTSQASHNDIRLLIDGLASRLNALANSDDNTLDQMAEVVEYIKANRNLIDQITTGKVSVSDIVNNLTTNAGNKPLSAAQGVTLKALIDAITVPTKTSQLENDSKFLTSYTETDPTVHAWAKAENKPTYTASEVGALPSDGGAINGALDFTSKTQYITPYLMAFKNASESGLSVKYPYTGFYQWGDMWEVSARDGNNSWAKTVFSIDLPSGVATFAVVPTVGGAPLALASDVPKTTETWTFTLEDGSIVTKAVYIE